MKGGAAFSDVPGKAHEQDRPLEWSILKRLFAYTQPYAFKRNMLILVVVIRSAQLPLLAWALSAVIAGPIQHGNFGFLYWGVLGFAALAFSTDFLCHFRMRLALELGEAVVRDLRNEIFAKIQTMPMAWYHRSKVGGVISRMTSDVESLRSGVQDVLFIAVVQIGQGLIAGVLMLIIDPVLFAILVAVVPGLYFLNQGFRKRMSRAAREVQESFSRVTANVAEAVGGIRVTQGFSREAENAEFFRTLIEDHSRYNLNISRAQAIYSPLLEVNTQVFTALLILIGGYRVLTPEIHVPVGDLIQFLFLANLFFSPIQALGNQYNSALTAMAGAERVFRLLDLKPDWEDLPSARARTIERGRIEFRQISFAYEPARPVLRDVSFVAEPGSCTALVGATGSGKTTILNLVAKFYLPSAGQVLLDGVDLQQIATSSLHQQMGIVQQQNFLFTGTVLDNIRLSRPHATEKEVLAVLDNLGCAALPDELPDGLATAVGERGAGMSLGQRQIICFARAMMANPKILLLDEATSSIDALTEFRLQTALALLLQGRTSFIVAHRLSTIRRADQVLVISHGRIDERGTHAELVAAGGSYAKLYRQFVQAGAGAAASV